MLVSAVLGAMSAIVLELAHRTIASEWPNAYASVKGLLERRARKGPIGYFLLRFTPPYLVGLACLVTAGRIGASPPLALGTMLIGFVALRDGRGLVRAIVGGPRRRVALGLLFAGNIFIVVLAALIALLSMARLDALVPKPNELVAALWTAALASILAVNLQRLLSQSFAADEEIIAGYQRAVGSDLWEYVARQAHANNCDPELMQSIVSCEATQRPKWIRWLETRLHFLWKTGSYGIAQMTSHRPLSDRESIRLLCEAFTNFYPDRDEQRLRRRPLKARLRSHNEDAWFCDQVVELYERLVPSYCLLSTSSIAAYDNRPTCEVLSIDSTGPTCWMKGTLAPCPGGELTLVDSLTGTHAIRLPKPSQFRQQWRRELVHESAEVEIRLGTTTLAKLDLSGYLR